jgi:signal transduction histidine kinase
MASTAPVHAANDAHQVRFATLVGPQADGDQAHTPDRDLIAVVAHELRNPLASLRLSLDMAMSEFSDLEPEAVHGLLVKAYRSACWLQGLAENLGSTTSLESGALSVRTEPTDILECIESAVLLVHGLLEQRHQSVRFTNSAGSTLALADPARVTQVIANLLTNASRYSVEHDVFDVHVSTVAGALRIRVTDHGPGISPEEQQRIFGRWVRGATSTGAGGGLGLGLSIVQNLVERQGGRVGVESRVGAGATFWFTLPLAELPCAQSRPMEAPLVEAAACL